MPANTNISYIHICNSNTQMHAMKPGRVAWTPKVRRPKTCKTGQKAVTLHAFGVQVGLFWPGGLGSCRPRWPSAMVGWFFSASGLTH